MAAPNAAAIRAAKRSLRKSMAQQLGSMTRQDVMAQSREVTKRVLASSTYRNATSISIYVSMSSGEVDTDELCRHTIASGKKLYVPLFAAPADAGVAAVANPPPASGTATFAADMRMLRLRNLGEYEGMKLNKWGIREPEDWIQEGSGPERTRREDALDASTGGDGLDLILAPGVAFDAQGGRLGHGKGYYDRYLASAEAFARKMGRQRPVCVALGLTQQVLPQGHLVPKDNQDRVLDGIVTPRGVIQGAVGEQTPSSSSSSTTTSPPLRYSLIAALSPSNGLGKEGGLSWTLKGEMAYFRKATSYVPLGSHPHAKNAVVMGRNTWESIPPKFRPLKGRVNIVVSRSVGQERQRELGIDPAQDSHLAPSLSAALDLLRTFPSASASAQADAQAAPQFHTNPPLARTFLIGGSQLYAQALGELEAENAGSEAAILDRLLITRIFSPAFPDCDVFLPEFRTGVQRREDVHKSVEAVKAAEAAEAEVEAGGQEALTSPRWSKARGVELLTWLGEAPGSGQEQAQGQGQKGKPWVQTGVVNEAEVSYEFQMWTRA